MLCLGLADSFWKIPAQALGAARTIFFRSFFVLLVVVPYFLFSEKKSYLSPDAVLATLGISVLSYLGLYFFARATRSGLTSVVVPVTASSALFTLLLHIITLDNATMNAAAATALAITMAGLGLLKFNWRGGRLHLAVLKEGGLRFALLAAVFLGISLGYAWFAVTFVGPPLFSLIQESVILLLAGLHSFCYNCYNSRSENHFLNRMGIFEPCEPESRFPWMFSLQLKQNLFYLALIGVLGSLGSVFRTIALDKASINTVTGIVVMAPVISVFFGRLYYGERLSTQQLLAVFLIIAGVYGISYFRYYSF